MLVSSCGGATAPDISATGGDTELSPAWVDALSDDDDDDAAIDPAVDATPDPTPTATTEAALGAGTPLPALRSTPLPAAVAAPVPTSGVDDFPTGIEPVRLAIPAIGVDAPTIDLDLRGPEPEVPQNFADTGWYTQTRRPGEIGPAIIAGHVDSASGPAVFARLDELQVGDEIIVSAADGESRTFAVVDSAQYSKYELPESVFGFGGPQPELRLITCGGTFDRSTGHYRDNLVVFAAPLG